MSSRMSASLPLEGVRVLELTAVWAGPFCSSLLADWGAEVIRIESIARIPQSTRAPHGGSIMRPSAALMEKAKEARNLVFAYPDWEPGERPWNRWAFFNVHARNKLSVTLEVDRPQGRRRLFDLLAVSDVFIENNAPDTQEKLGLSYPELRRVRPDLVMVSIPAFGISGPYKDYRAIGLNIDGATGHTHLRGDPNSDVSTRGTVAVSDATGAVLGAFGAVAALRHRRRTGQGLWVEVAQADGLLACLPEALADWSMNRRQAGPLGNGHPFWAPHDCFPCKGTDEWIVIAVTSDEEWASLRRAMGDPGWAADARFSGTLARWDNRAELHERIARWTAGYPAGELFSVLQALRVPAGPVLTERGVAEDTHVRARGFFQRVTQADSGTHDYPGFPWRMENTPNAIRLPPCGLGEHNAYVYQELLGMDAKGYAALRDAGDIGDSPR